MRIQSLCALALALPPAAGFLHSAEPIGGRELRVDLPYQAERSDPVTHQVDFSVVVTAPYHCQVLKVWLPLPQSDAAQQISDSRLSTFPQEVKPRIDAEPVYGNKFAYFEFHEPQGAQIIRHRFSAKISELRWNVDPDKVTDVESWPAEFDPYLAEEKVTREEDFQRVLGEIVPGRDSGAGDLLGAMRWIDQNLKYDHAAASLSADSSQAFHTRRGHCSDYHGLCATMGRRLGYPACVTYGLALVPKNSPSHCKMEAFLPSYGWVSFDLSETQKLEGKIQENAELSAEQVEELTAAARQRLYRGFRENSWLLLTRGVGYQLAPPASRPVRVVRTIYAEADGEPLPEPDPANEKERKFSWMTVHKYTADRPFTLPFNDLSTLDQGAE